MPTVTFNSYSFSFFVLPVFGATAKRAGNTTSGQLRSALYSTNRHIDAIYDVVSWHFVSLPHRIASTAEEHLEFQESLDHKESVESQ